MFENLVFLVPDRLSAYLRDVKLSVRKDVRPKLSLSNKVYQSRNDLTNRFNTINRNDV